ncbi:MAG: hypothetical protein ACI8PZ_006993 [Myxococcota bacterium]
MIAVLATLAGLSLADEPPETPGTLLGGVKVSGFAQIDYLRRQISEDELSDGTGELLNEDRFLLRHARIRVAKDWRHVGLFSVTELFAGGSVVRPIGFDIHAQVPGKDPDDLPPVRVTVGLFPVPFGFESFGQTDDQRFFGERALMTYALIPGRFDLGAALSGHLWAIDWMVAVQNGEPLESGPYAYADPNAAKDVAARVRISGALVGGLHAAAATSVLTGKGFSAGTRPTKDSFEWQDLNEDGRVLVSELVPIPGSAGRPSRNFDRWGLGGDVQVWGELPRLGELLVVGEVAVAVNLDRAVAPADPVLLGRDQRSVGFLVAATQELTPLFTLGVRYDQYDPNRDALELFDGITVVTRRRFQTVTSGASLNHHMSEAAWARLLVEYAVQQNSLGRDAAGRPAQLDNNTFRMRAQVVL